MRSIFSMPRSVSVTLRVFCFDDVIAIRLFRIVVAGRLQAAHDLREADVEIARSLPPGRR